MKLITQIGMKLKNLNCDKTQKLIFNELKNSNKNETQKLKLWRRSKT